MKVLIVGYGYMGEIRKQVVDRLGELTLAGVCDPFKSPEKTGCNCPHYLDFHEAVDDIGPDITFVCSPNRDIPDVAVYAMRRGSHVFCEKPPGRNIDDIRRMMAAEAQCPGIKLMFGFNHRHHPAIIEAKSIIDAGRMGQVLWVRGVYGKSGGQGRGFESSWRNDPAISGGGILLDQGIHMLDLFRLFCGDFDEAVGMTGTRFWKIPVEDNAFVILRNAKGQMAQLHSSATLWKHTFRVEVGLEGGYLIIHGLLSKTGSYGRETLIIGRRPDDDDPYAAVGNPREETVFFDKDLSWDLQVEEMVRCIKYNLPVTNSSSTDALRVMEIIAAVYRQAHRGDAYPLSIDEEVHA
jgi:predicted dehydrogenase